MEAIAKVRSLGVEKNARSLHTLILMAIVAVAVFILTKWLMPQLFVGNVIETLEKYLGFSWPFFTTLSKDQ